MAHEVRDPWDGGGHFYASEATEADRPTESKLLGPDGRPLKYEPRQPVGFAIGSRAKHGDQ